MPDAAPWLLLIHQLPPHPPYPRVKVWRRLQGLGAVSVKNSVYVLPRTAEALEDFQWVVREIEQGNGEASVCAAAFVDGLSDDHVRALFRAARDEDYAAQTAELRPLFDAPASDEATASQLRRIKRRYAQVRAIDFFDAPGGAAVAAMIAELEGKVAGHPTGPAGGDPLAGLRGRVWVTRAGVGVDRMASAWLVKRFIDPGARFRFLADGDRPGPGEVRFDMFEGEFTHVADRCTAEVLAGLLARDDAALSAIAEIVHDLDIKDARFQRDEAPGIGAVIAGIAKGQDTDEARIARAEALFDDLYHHFGRRTP